MSFTSKEEYGLLAVIHLAEHMGEGPIQTREIARVERIPEQFLEQVLSALRREGITRSTRGASGGHELARSPRDITAADVIRALSGDIMPIQCETRVADRCDNADACVVLDLRHKVRSSVLQVLDSTTIHEMMEERRRRRQQDDTMMNI